MHLPDGAVFEAQLAGGLALWDVGHLLPTHARKRYAVRDASQIEHQFWHHSGAHGADGYAGLRNSARYVVDHRRWPGAAYHYWLSTEADRDADDRIVVYRAHPDPVRSYHTGGAANDTGVGVCLQGNLTRARLTRDQVEAMEALIPWLFRCHPHMRLQGPDGLSWHADSARFGGSGKEVCPGLYAERWLQRYRDTMPRQCSP